MGGLMLLSLALVVGSLVWAACILRIGRGAKEVDAAIARRCGDVLRAGALALAVFQALKILTKGFVLVVSGVVLTLFYVGTWDGLLGTGYGSLVSAKMLLLALALGFAALNFRAGRSWVRDPGARAITARVPFYIESEAFLLVAILFVAASLSSMPPAVEWSDYNHNVAGVFLVVMGCFALLSYVRGCGWARYWPVGFVLLGVFLFFRADAEAWPLGPLGFWVSMFGNAEILQHRLATVLAFALGMLEMRARTHPRASVRCATCFRCCARSAASCSSLTRTCRSSLIKRRIDQSQRRLDPKALERQIGRLLQRNARAAAPYAVSIEDDDAVDAGVRLQWRVRSEWEEWARLSEGNLHPSQQRARLERRAALEDLHPAHRSRGRLPDPQIRS